ncbi:MAG TPA: hypothetical protein VFD41_02735 [Actinomycetales bacterium]|nr:hypothetical protein [Actinomycetales bacterium]
MTTSPAFLAEIDDQVTLARQDLESARAAGDEAEIVVARDRLADLDEIARRATDATLLHETSWP